MNRTSRLRPRFRHFWNNPFGLSFEKSTSIFGFVHLTCDFTEVMREVDEEMTDGARFQTSIVDMLSLEAPSH